jgi:hypothetical protein
MAVAFVQEFSIGARSTANYDYVKKQLGDGPFDGPEDFNLFDRCIGEDLAGRREPGAARERR